MNIRTWRCHILSDDAVADVERAVIEKLNAGGKTAARTIKSNCRIANVDRAVLNENRAAAAGADIGADRRVCHIQRCVLDADSAAEIRRVAGNRRIDNALRRAAVHIKSRISIGVIARDYHSVERQIGIAAENRTAELVRNSRFAPA